MRFVLAGLTTLLIGRCIYHVAAVGCVGHLRVLITTHPLLTFPVVAAVDIYMTGAVTRAGPLWSVQGIYGHGEGVDFDLEE